MMPNVSVVIPLYNKAPFIKRTLKSVLSQTFTNFEVIVVNDGSTDSSDELVASFDDPRIRLISQPNAGVSAARNNGIAAARGDLVFFLDGDDAWTADYVECVVRQTAKYPDIGFFASAIQRTSSAVAPDAPTAVQPRNDRQTVVTDLPDAWRKGTLFVTSSACMRKSLLEQLAPCFPVGESLGEDMDLWFRAAERSHLLYIEDRLVLYTTDVEGSLSAKPEPRELLPFIQRMEARLSNGQTPHQLRRSSRAYVDQARITIARLNIEDGKRLSAMMQLARARNSMMTPRWLTTLLFALLASGPFVKAWEAKRRTRFH